MNFTVLTPSFNSLPYLRRCCASVADQAGPAVQHLVVDGASADGTVDWLRARAQPFISEPDHGMYDALNKGLDRAGGDVVAWLNCDEQYLPGTLAAVEEAFQRHPQADAVFGDALLIRPDGSLVAYRKTHPLRASWVAASHLYALSCTLFFRRRLFAEGCRFDVSYRAIGDMDLILRLLRAGRRFLHLPRYLAAFTLTGKNLTLDQRAVAERVRLDARQPRWIRWGRPLLNTARLADKWAHGGYRQGGPLCYAVHVEPGQPRRAFKIDRASFRWSWDAPTPP